MDTSMVQVPGDSGDTFAISPETLSELAMKFYKANEDMINLEVSLYQDTQTLITDMSKVLKQSPASLQHFFSRWSNAMFSLADAYQSVGDNIQIGRAHV